MNTSPKTAILECRDLELSYGRLPVLQNIKFSLEMGRVLALLGPSGCGKSSLLHIVAGLLAPNSGEILFCGNKSCILPGWISYMQQNDLLLPWKTVLENIALPLLIKGAKKVEARKQVRARLSQFGLEGFEQYYPAQLSGGMRQRASLMRSTLIRSDFLLLDEPFSRLDSLTRFKLYDWFQEYLLEHRPGLVLVTHDPEEAVLLADEIILLSSRPARIIQNILVHSEHPRSRSILSKKSKLLEEIIAKISVF